MSTLLQRWLGGNGPSSSDSPPRISSRHHPARLLYHTSVEQSRHPYFYTQCQVADSIDGRFDMIAMHLFIILDRLQKIPQSESLSQGVMTIFVDDMDRGLREIGVGDLGVGRRVRVMVEALHGRLDAYRTAFGQGTDSVSAAIARNVYRQPRVDPAAISSLVSYFFNQCTYISEQSNRFLLRGEVQFKPPFQNMVL